MVACQQEEEEEEASEPADGSATIVLSLGGAQLYTELLTRSEVPVGDLSHYAFVLNGTTISGAVVSNLPLSVDNDGKAEVNAGTYTLTASNADYANTEYGHPLYIGTSESFTIAVNETQNIAIALGKPKNARITMAIDDSFTALYENPVLTLSDGNRTITMDTEVECYFTIPASGALAYTITANALAGSHVTDISTATGYVEIQAGYNTTVRLKANPATGIIIPVVEGDYTGTFD